MVARAAAKWRTAEAWRPRPASARSELGLLDKLRSIHWPLVGALMLLGMIGYLVLYSAGGGSHSPWAARHGARLVFGACIMLAVALVDIRVWFRWAFPLYAVRLLDAARCRGRR